jgi:hypothetical protein
MIEFSPAPARVVPSAKLTVSIRHVPAGTMTTLAALIKPQTWLPTLI